MKTHSNIHIIYHINSYNKYTFIYHAHIESQCEQVWLCLIQIEPGLFVAFVKRLDMFWILVECPVATTLTRCLFAAWCGDSNGKLYKIIGFSWFAWTWAMLFNMLFALFLVMADHEPARHSLSDDDWAFGRAAHWQGLLQFDSRPCKQFSFFFSGRSFKTKLNV